MGTKWHNLDKPARIQAIKDAWEPGCSAGDIARAIGGITRNAIIGYYTRYRLELADCPLRTRSGSKLPKRRREEPKPRLSGDRKPKAIRHHFPTVIMSEEREEPAPIVPDEAAESYDATALMLDLMSLTSETCKYPIGDPKQGPFGFCGHVTREGSPYCLHHHIRCHGEGTPSERSAVRTARSCVRQEAA